MPLSFAFFKTLELDECLLDLLFKNFSLLLIFLVFDSSLLSVLRMVEVVVLELFGHFVKFGLFFRSQSLLQLFVQFNQQGMSWLDFVSSCLFQSLEFKPLLVIFVVQFINRRTEFPLESLKVFLELFWHSESLWVSVRQVTVIFFYSFLSSASQNVWDFVRWIVDFSQHDCSQILAIFWIKILWLCAQDVVIDRTHFQNTSIGFHWHGQSEILVKNVWVKDLDDFMNSFELLGSKIFLNKKDTFSHWSMT